MLYNIERKNNVLNMAGNGGWEKINVFNFGCIKKKIIAIFNNQSY